MSLELGRFAGIPCQISHWRSMMFLLLSFALHALPFAPRLATELAEWFSLRAMKLTRGESSRREHLSPRRRHASHAFWSSVRTQRTLRRKHAVHEVRSAVPFFRAVCAAPPSIIALTCRRCASRAPAAGSAAVVGRNLSLNLAARFTSS